ncbi:MAG: GAF domain-containing protein [Candidatus Riflebacteria bacterium]|nr:GAF domain-containing protein [Candidatus Riflebacteria bacterium]
MKDFKFSWFILLAYFTLVYSSATAEELVFVYPKDPFPWALVLILTGLLVLVGSGFLYLFRTFLGEKKGVFLPEMKILLEKTYAERLKEEYEKKHEELRILAKELRARYSVSLMKVRKLTLTLNPAELFDSICEMLKSEIRVKKYIIFLKDKEKNELYPFRWDGYLDNEVESLIISIESEHLLTFSCAKRRMLYSFAAVNDPETSELVGREPSLGTILAMPLSTNSESFGVIHIAEFEGNQKELDENDLRFYSSLSAFMGMALSNANVFLQTRGELSSAKLLSEKQIKEKKKLRDIFSKYTSTELVDALLKNPGSVRLGGVTKNATILFSDIVDFTKFTLNLSPEEVVLAINEYLSIMTEIVLSHNGEIDKFIGDSIMGRFGVLADLPNSALSAVKCAQAMLDELKKLQAKWVQEKRNCFSIRVGIATGPVLAGNIGSEKRQEFTVMGSTVNLASRLENLNKQFGTSILIDESTNSLVNSEIMTLPREKVSIRGFEGFIKVYEVVTKKKDLNSKIQKTIL